MSNEAFWQNLDQLIASHNLVIDRPAGSTHPRFADFVYPYDYGYLQDTLSSDSGGVDVWRGSLPVQKVTAVICTVDLNKKDAELKLLLGCTPDEARNILVIHNRGQQSGLLILRASR